MMREFETLPENPNQRRVIIALGQTDIDRLDMDDSRELVGRRDVAIVDADAAILAETGLTAALARKGLLRAGTTLIQSPFSGDAYAEIVEASRAFALHKFAVMCVASQHLGARSIKISKVMDEKTGATWDVQSQVGKGPVSAAGNAKHEELKSLGMKLNLEEKYPGGPANVEAALEHLKKWQLDDDRELVWLVEARSVQSNSLQSKLLQLDLSHQSERSLAIAASIKVPAYLSMNADIAKTAADSSHFVLEYTIDF